jgi:hypothetical protein
MIERLTAKPGVTALRVSGHIARSDIDEAFQHVSESFANHPKTSLYIEVAQLTGIDTEALTDDFRRGCALLDKLDRFGRVAVVSDEAWVRWAARIESALLPGNSYRTYTFAQRQQPLDWIQEREDLPYGHALKIMPTTRADVIGIEINGRLAAEEVAQFARDLNRMRHERPLHAVLVRFRSLAGFDPSIAADREYLRMKLGLLSELDRYALVGGPDWLVTWAELLRPLLRLELRHFAVDDEAAAWSWLGAQPLVDQPAAA